MDQHEATGPTALVETNGSMRVVRVLQFGAGITELAEATGESTTGSWASSRPPLVKGGSITVEGVAPHADLVLDAKAGSGKSNRADRRKSAKNNSAGGRVSGGPSRAGGRGDR
ncbi:hypothetical protein GQR58_029271 [Nymphon striatum]|nr:hypothetical protein GQR58_029271 [Nymphon striatum]